MQPFVTLFGIGKRSNASLIASILALPVAFLILRYLGMETLFMLTLVVSIIGVFESNKYLAQEGSSKEEIVIDDLAGTFMSIMIILPTAATLPFAQAPLAGLVLASAAYLLFALWKPSTIGWLYRELKGGLGIVLSGILAGMAGGLLGTVVLIGVRKLL